MTKFVYKAKRGPDKIVDGFIEAPTFTIAIRKVMAMGLMPLEVTQTAAPFLKQEVVPRTSLSIKQWFMPSRRLPHQEVVFFMRQMNDLVEASVPVLRSLRIVGRQARHPLLNTIVQQMYLFVQNGGSLSDALAQHPSVFSPFYVNMVKTGEVGGRLPIVLARLAGHLEKEQETREKICSSLAYPILVLVVGILTVFVLLTFVIPRLSVMFEDLEQALPLPTVILINTSDFFAGYWWLLVGIFVMIKIYGKWWMQSPQGSRTWANAQLKLPFFGEFIRIVEMERFIRALSMLLEGGVPVTSALNAIEPTIENVVLRQEIQKVSKAVTDGIPLKTALGQSAFFPETVTSIVAVGEESGRLDKALHKIAETLERQADQTVKIMMSLLGPIVLIIIVAIVGFAVIAMLLPIFRMNMLIQ